MTTAKMPLHVAVGKRLAGKLREHGITYEQLGETCGWSTSSISRRIRGETALSLSDLECIEAATGISVSTLLGDQAEPLITSIGGQKQQHPFRSGGDSGASNTAPSSPTGRTANNNGQPNDNLRKFGGYSLLLPRLDSNQQPFGLRQLLQRYAAA
jgi:transcriptional regulator with XRE-family HTH domain